MISIPPNFMVPESNFSRPQIHLKSVVFPQPEGPTIAIISPDFKFRFKSLNKFFSNDFDNPSHPVSGIVVQAPITDEGSDGDTMVYAIMGGVFLVAVAMVGFFVSRSRSGDDDYYYDDDDSYYEDDYEYDDEEYEYEDDDSESE